MNYAGTLGFEATVEHRLIRADGSVQDFGPDTRVIRRSIPFWRTLWQTLKRSHIPWFSAMSFATFVEWIRWQPQLGMQLMELCRGLCTPKSIFEGVPILGIVTSAGIDYLATTFVSNTNPLINFNYHTYGTGDVHGSTSTPTNATAASPIVVTQASQPFFLNDIIKLTGITGITGINGIWQLSPVASGTYTLLGSTGGGSGFGGGTNAAQLLNGQADTALTTEASGITRVAGTQSNPSANVYKTLATVTFSGTTPPLTIIEWGLLSASSSGTLWDRRWLNTANAPSTTASAALTAAPITITSTSDSIQTTYTLTCTAGGS
jgi:hypothetical protein